MHIAFASREFKITEQGAEGTYGKICVDAIVAVVNKINPLDRVTADMLKKYMMVLIVNGKKLNK